LQGNKKFSFIRRREVNNMKCYACGYEHDHEKKPTKIWDTELCLEERSKEFTHIDATATIKVEANYGGDILSKVNLYACPKCGTVRMEKW
jgi:ribosomal protein L37AE/L43A